MTTGTAQNPPRRSHPLRANMSWTLSGNLIYAASQFAMLAVLAKVSTKEMVGYFALGQAICTPVIMFAALQLRNVQVTDTRREYTFGDYLALRLATSAVALLVIAAVSLLPNFRGQAGEIIFAIGLAKTFESISDIYYGLFQQQERMDIMARSMMIKGPLSLLALAGGMLLTHNLLVSIFAMAAAWVLLLVVYDMPNGNRMLRRQGVPRWPHWCRIALPALTLLALPLGAMRTLISLNAYIPRYFIEHFNGVGQLGIFAAMAYIMVALDMVIISLQQSALPRLATYYADHNDRMYRVLLLKLVAIGLGLLAAGVLIVVCFGKPLLTLIYNAEYARTDVFLVIMVAAGLTGIGTLLNAGSMAARSFTPLTVLYLVCTLASLGMCFIFIPRAGLLGAAWTMAVTSTVHIAGSIGIIALALRGKRNTVVATPGMPGVS